MRRFLFANPTAHVKKFKRKLVWPVKNEELIDYLVQLYIVT